MSQNPQILFPALRYRDAHAAIGWLEAALGAQRGMVSENSDGVVVHAELSIAGATVMLGSNTEGDDERVDLPVGGSTVYLALDSEEAVDVIYERAIGAGAQMLYPLAEKPYGSHEFTMTDPEGNAWSVGTYRPTSDAAL